MRFDLHVHSIYSMDSITPVEKLCERYAKLGFSGFALTDHRTFSGVARAQKYAREKNLPIEVVGGCEFMSEHGEVLGLCLNDAIPAPVSALPSSSPSRPIHPFAPLCDAIHDQGGFVVLPHPYDSLRSHACAPESLTAQELRLIDGLEVFNARVVGGGPNQKASDFASPHSLLSTGGSDAHFLFEAGAGYTEIPEGMELAMALRKKQSVGMGKSSPFYVHGPTTLIKWGKRLGLLPRAPSE